MAEYERYMVVDPKGGVLSQVGAFLQRRGYRIKAVSYTHLDVYKRQAYSKAFPWYSEWLDKDNQEHAQNNIDRLNNILVKYI